MHFDYLIVTRDNYSSFFFFSVIMPRVWISAFMFVRFPGDFILHKRSLTLANFNKGMKENKLRKVQEVTRIVEILVLYHNKLYANEFEGFTAFQKNRV